MNSSSTAFEYFLYVQRKLKLRGKVTFLQKKSQVKYWSGNITVVNYLQKNPKTKQKKPKTTN